MIVLACIGNAFRLHTHT